MRKPKLRELKEAIKALIKGPYTSKFPAVPSPAPHYRGKPVFDEKECVGCGACALVCPAHAIDVIDPSPLTISKEETKSLQSTQPTSPSAKKPEVSRRTIILHYDNCIFCGQCQANCLTEKGISLTPEYDLAFLKDREKQVATIEKEVAFCEICGAVISTIEHLRYLAKKLGPLAFSNPNLILSHQEEEELIKKAPPGKISHPRSGHMRLLCPKCRRETVLKEEWQ